MENTTGAQLAVSRIRQVLLEELQTLLDGKVPAEQRETHISHRVVIIVLELMQRIEDLEKHLGSISAAMENQVRERTAQRTWEERQRIGFK